ncbi:hypothetical protein HK102_004098 [Quaeritorhiza haematococci]|nr:hypothetical protein HK102_004098 [Quaeritorhiza haematococci]
MAGQDENVELRRRMEEKDRMVRGLEEAAMEVLRMELAQRDHVFRQLQTRLTQITKELSDAQSNIQSLIKKVIDREGDVVEQYDLIKMVVDQNTALANENDA